jgi:hypothetical protein
MDIFFQDPSEVPLPPAEVRIRELKAEPWPDGRRVRVYFEVDPYQRRPNADLTIHDAGGREIAAVSIIEPMDRKMELTMHLRGSRPEGALTLRAVLFYSEPKETEAEDKSAGGEPGESLPEVPEQVITVVDRKETKFEIP